MAVETLSTVLLADDLSATVVTEVIQDPETGLYAREFRFFSTAAAGSNTVPCLLIVRAVSPEEDCLKIKTPTLSI